MICPVNYEFISQEPSANHMAIDLAAPMGADIVSPCSGRVIAVGNDPNYIGGRYVIIREDGTGMEAYMGHCQDVVVSYGQNVREGQLVAHIGTTGQSTGPHTHFQIRQQGGGNLINPRLLINFEEYKMSMQDVLRGEAGYNWVRDKEITTLLRRDPSLTYEQYQKGYEGRTKESVLDEFAPSDEAVQARSRLWHYDAVVAETVALRKQLAAVNAELSTKRSNADVVAALDRIKDTLVKNHEN